jgi:ArsR family transcriptional regulator
MATASHSAVPDLERAESLFHALSDATRLSILEMLRDGERCVCELQDELDAAQSRLSFHLRVLKEAGLVTDRREGRWMYYTIVPGALAEVHDLAVSMQPRKGALPTRQLPLRKVASCCR